MTDVKQIKLRAEELLKAQKDAAAGRVLPVKVEAEIVRRWMTVAGLSQIDRGAPADPVEWTYEQTKVAPHHLRRLVLSVQRALDVWPEPTPPEDPR